VSIEEIEAAISELPASKLFALSSWFEKYHATVWDPQIKRDLEAGHLDSFWLKLMRSTNPDCHVHCEAQGTATFLEILSSTSRQSAETGRLEF